MMFSQHEVMKMNSEKSCLNCDESIFRLQSTIPITHGYISYMPICATWPLRPPPNIRSHSCEAWRAKCLPKNTLTEAGMQLGFESPHRLHNQQSTFCFTSASRLSRNRDGFSKVVFCFGQLRLKAKFSSRCNSSGVWQSVEACSSGDSKVVKNKCVIYE